jgi:hypothetical protein
VVALQLEDLQHRLRGDVRIAVAVTADPRAEAQRTGVERQLHAEPGKLVGQRLERSWHGVRVQRIEVVDRVAGLVDHLGTHDAQLVGLPQQVHQLRQPAPDASLGAWVARPSRRPERAIPLVEQRRDLLRLREHGAARRLGGVSGEHRAQRDPGEVVGDVGRAELRAGDPVDGLGEPRAVLHANGRELPSAMHLLGDVREQEVGRERARQLGGAGRVELAQERRRRRGLARQQVADPLEELEQLLALLADERVAEQLVEPAQIAAQPDARIRGVHRTCGG